MAKMSRVSLARKRELEKPDRILEFLQSVSLWVSQNRKQTAIAAGSFLGIVIVVSAVFYFSGRAENKAFERLTQIMPAEGEAVVADSATAEKYRQLNKKYGNTVAGKIAGLKYADVSYELGDYKQAVSAYQNAVSDFKDNHFFRIMALNGLGYAAEAAGEIDRAVNTFKQIVDEPGAPLKDKALFQLGLLYKQQGDQENSRKVYQRILDDYPDSLYAEVIREDGVEASTS